MCPERVWKSFRSRTDGVGGREERIWEVVEKGFPNGLATNGFVLRIKGFALGGTNGLLAGI